MTWESECSLCASAGESLAEKSVEDCLVGVNNGGGGVGKGRLVPVPVRGENGRLCFVLDLHYVCCLLLYFPSGG